ncbi:GH25 family lysozyme [Hydrogenoanaerobacterium sp.]|uniref:GH25 family lysozyme n=1 Tax=Hydrogenoanaerobacterium sp. TaxID=2953763 RepID=UPI00289735FC|nr:GH25 family lysozyme [Hydrogenoanaerobacterium sp.]
MAKLHVIDISEHNVRNGRIDWERVKASGVHGVMVRIGWAGFDGKLMVDKSLDDSITRAHAAGLGVGLYVYSYCTGAVAARAAARQAAKIANSYKGKITYPICFDVEETVLPHLTRLGKSKLTDTVAAFCNEVEKSGYYAMWYTYTYFAKAYLDIKRLAPYDLWVADYRSTVTCPWDTPHGMWQYRGDEGRCDGVTGACDRNYAYKDYPAIIRAAGLNHLTGVK